MGHFKKYKSFRDLSTLLITENEFLDSYVHAAYYSVVQLMEYILIEEFNSFADHNAIYKRTNELQVSVHKFLRGEILKSIKNRDNWILFKNNFPILEQSRVKSDYTDMSINYNEAKKIDTSLNKVYFALENEFLK